MPRELLDLDGLEINKVSCTYRECVDLAVAMVLGDDVEDEDKVGFLCPHHLFLMKCRPKEFTRIGFEFRERYADELDDS